MGGRIRHEGLAEQAIQLATDGSVGLQPRQFFLFRPEGLGNIFCMDTEDRGEAKYSFIMAGDRFEDHWTAKGQFQKKMWKGRCRSG